MKKLFNRILLLTAVLCLLSVNVKIFAADDISIYLNGSKLTFTTAQPINRGGRVYAPIREIAEQLGFTVNFNDEIRLATFERNNLRVEHYLGTNIITIIKDGSSRSPIYDAASVVENNRTLMPVRMLAETLDAGLNYDDASKSVFITVVEVKEQPTVTNIGFSPTSAMSGETVTIVVTANSQTSRVRLENDTNIVIGESTNYTSNFDGSRLFSFTWTPSVTTTAFLPVVATPGDLVNYNSDGKLQRSMSVSALPDPEITNISIPNGKKYLNDTITFTVTTNAYATKVRLSNDYNSNTVESTDYTISGDSRIFKIDVKAESSGSRDFTVEVSNDNGYVSESTKIYTVDVISNSVVNRLAILDVAPTSPIEVRPGNKTTVTVTTSSYATRVQICDEYYDVIQTLSSPTSTNSTEGEKTWKFTVTAPSSTGTYRYYAVAYDGSSNSSQSTDYRFTLVSTNSAASSSKAIKSVTSSPANAIIGGYANITVVTDMDIDYVEIYDYRGNSIRYMGSPSSTNRTQEEQTWNFNNIYIENSSYTSFTVRAYPFSGSHYSESITLNTGSSSGSSNSKINTVNTDRTRYFVGDRVYVDVQTSDDINKITVINDANDQIFTLDYDYTSGSTEWWTGSFTITSSASNQTLRVRATDKNGNIHEKSVTIAVSN